MAAPAPPSDAESETELLARSVTHELRQPLSLIIGYAELLARAPDELTRAELLGEIRRAAARLGGSLAKLERADCVRPPSHLSPGRAPLAAGLHESRRSGALLL